ncbi:hypothetical protein [Wenyingzhuangia marina]|uniref:Uncharacterized protein n=1 Tax=Wenyingzhuangia marina TaxID=1195760 RepID=A0A1M5WXU9_9FLAO|nr:hypothetical protein [Wenyingzhuangia marina]GGF82261.1 membrane protein [Wenyingzhuangia marina]SHH91723.1 hypothetical protein SAMN05444281_2700 [Wenyingzhuangia marina]
MKQSTNKYLITALLIGLVFHGTAMFFTLETTYDALIHLFFADHYANSWFEPWSFKWYTGFTVMSYPPLVHQTIALLSFIGGLKFGLFTTALIAVVLFITGTYRFSLLITSNRSAAGYAAILATLSSTFIETLHLFGQLPSIVGVSVLLHAMPEIYLWIREGKLKHLFTSLSLISVTVTSHHVTPIFGMVFFISPLIGTVIMDTATQQAGSLKKVSIRVFLLSFKKSLKRIFLFIGLALTIIVTCLLPYWINSKNNPITQVPIPHGSRDNFIEITSSGLVFFLIPWGVVLFLLPYIFYRYYHKRYIFFGISLSMLTLLGTGGTTPLPKMILGANAFNILTLDRFTLWAAIMSIPMVGEFVLRFSEGDLKQIIQKRFSPVYHRLSGGFLAFSFLFMSVFTISLGYFRPSQPQKIKILPIVNFLNQDQHDQWRYLTLGFGDQMAWLSANTKALTVDGNYHSARRLPELTTRAIERLENSKFKGIEGIGSLQQFLTVPEKYNLKYIFSNDKFYDPILYFCGWQRLRQLENGIMVWEKLNVPPISVILPRVDVATWQKIHWGTVPLLTVILAFLINSRTLLTRTFKTKKDSTIAYIKESYHYKKFSWKLVLFLHVWVLFLLIIVGFTCYSFYIKNDSQRSPENAILTYYDALDFKRFEKAHSLINPDSDLPIAQYMLQISVTDGLLSSYAKMDSIHINITERTDSTAVANIKTAWITALEKVNDSCIKTLVKKNGNWYINPEVINKDLPPDQLFVENKPTYFNQGRRRITTEQTYHEDVLKQPVLEILTAKLIKSNEQYSVIGEIQNIDNVPADVVLKGTLYNNNNELLATFNAKDQVKHKLLPKEITSFKIDFEGIAWLNLNETSPKTFNPDEFTDINLSDVPTKFDLQIAGNVSGSDLYKKVAISKLDIDSTKISGLLFNSGTAQATIPELIFTFYNKDKEPIYVDHTYVIEGIRQQRKHYFEYKIPQNQSEIISSGMENCFVNGLPNKSIAGKIASQRNGDIHHPLIKINHLYFSYVKIEINNYTGVPY